MSDRLVALIISLISITGGVKSYAVRDYISHAYRAQLDECASRIEAARKQSWGPMVAFSFLPELSSYPIRQWVDGNLNSAYRGRNELLLYGLSKNLDGQYVAVTDHLANLIAWGKVEKTIWSPEDQQNIVLRFDREDEIRGKKKERKKDPKWAQGLVLRTPNGKRTWVSLSRWSHDAIADHIQMNRVFEWAGNGIPNSPTPLGNCLEKGVCALLEENDEAHGGPPHPIYSNQIELAIATGSEEIQDRNHNRLPINLCLPNGPGGYTFQARAIETMTDAIHNKPNTLAIPKGSNFEIIGVEKRDRSTEKHWLVAITLDLSSPLEISRAEMVRSYPKGAQIQVFVSIPIEAIESLSLQPLPKMGVSW